MTTSTNSTPLFKNISCWFDADINRVLIDEFTRQGGEAHRGLEFTLAPELQSVSEVQTETVAQPKSKRTRNNRSNNNTQQQATATARPRIDAYICNNSSSDACLALHARDIVVLRSEYLQQCLMHRALSGTPHLIWQLYILEPQHNYVKSVVSLHASQQFDQVQRANEAFQHWCLVKAQRQRGLQITQMQQNEKKQIERLAKQQKQAAAQIQAQRAQTIVIDDDDEKQSVAAISTTPVESPSVAMRRIALQTARASEAAQHARTGAKLEPLRQHTMEQIEAEIAQMTSRRGNAATTAAAPAAAAASASAAPVPAIVDSAAPKKNRSVKRSLVKSPKRTRSKRNKP